MSERKGDRGPESRREAQHDPRQGLRMNTSASASRALKRRVKAFLSKHHDGRYVTIQMHPDHIELLGFQPGDLANMQISEHCQPRELVIRKAKHRGLQLLAKTTDGWCKLRVPFEEGCVADLFAKEGYLIPSEVKIADDGTMRIVLADAPTAPIAAPPQPELPGTAGEPSKAADLVPTTFRSEGSTTAFPSTNTPDHPRPKAEAHSRRRPVNSYTRVTESPHGGRWQATVYFARRPISVGSYPSPHEAAYAHNLAERKLYGEEARLNSIPIEHQPGTERGAAIAAIVDLRLRETGALGVRSAPHFGSVKSAVTGASAGTGPAAYGLRGFIIIIDSCAWATSRPIMKPLWRATTHPCSWTSVHSF